MEQLQTKADELEKKQALESDLIQKYEALQQLYDLECASKKDDQGDQSATLIKEMEIQLKDTKESFDNAKENWEKEEAQLRQKLE